VPTTNGFIIHVNELAMSFRIVLLQHDPVLWGDAINGAVSGKYVANRVESESENLLVDLIIFGR